jgi:hypothetical protein
LTFHGRDRPSDKLDVPCWAPHVATGNRRTAASIESVHALVLDFDDGADVNDVMALFPEKERCAYSTFSAEPSAPRCRLVLPLAAPVVGALWAATMRLILKDVGQDKNAADPKCIDPSRLYLLPCRGPVEVADYAPGDLVDVGEYVARAEYEAELARIAADHLRARHVARAEAARRWAEAPARDGLTDAEERGIGTDPYDREGFLRTAAIPLRLFRVHPPQDRHLFIVRAAARQQFKRSCQGIVGPTGRLSQQRLGEHPRGLDELRPVHQHEGVEWRVRRIAFCHAHDPLRHVEAFEHWGGAGPSPERIEAATI